MKIKMNLGIALPLCLFLVGGLVALWRGMCTVSDITRVLRPCLPIGAAVLLHELGHIAVARLLGVRLGGLRLSLFGARLGLRGVLSYRREFLIAAAGPLVNLVSAAVVLIPLWIEGEGSLLSSLGGEGGAATFALASLGLACINLLPVRTLDGGRMLGCFLAPLFGLTVAETVVTVGTAVCLGGLWCFSVYALLRVGEMLGMFAFSLCLLVRMAGRRADAK